jgi:hypothetical protein
MDDERSKRKANPAAPFPQHVAVVAAKFRGNQDRSCRVNCHARVDVGIQKRLVMQQVRRELRLAMFPEIIRTAADGVPDHANLRAISEELFMRLILIATSNSL